MKKQDKVLYTAIDDILWFDWDTVGMNQVESLRDEYQVYISHLLKLKKSGADKIKIADYLYRVIKVDMGMYGHTSTYEHCKEIAQKIVDL